MEETNERDLVEVFDAEPYLAVATEEAEGPTEGAGEPEEEAPSTNPEGKDAPAEEEGEEQEEEPKEGAAEGEPPPEEGPKDGEPPPKKRTISKRISDLTHERNEERTSRLAVERELEEAALREQALKERLAALEKGEEAPKDGEEPGGQEARQAPQDGAPEPPDVNAFIDEETGDFRHAEYAAAMAKHTQDLVRWGRERDRNEERVEREQAEQKRKADAAAMRLQEVTETFATRRAAHQASHPEYEGLEKTVDAALSGDAFISQQNPFGFRNETCARVGWEIMESELSPEVVSFFGANPEVLSDLLALPPAKALKRFGAIESRLVEAQNAPGLEPKKPPKPTPKVSPGGRVTARTVYDAKNIEEYAKLRGLDKQQGYG